MIAVTELRIGNYLMQKINNRIVTTKCTFQHFNLFESGNNKDIFPILLKADLLEKCGFKENKEYPLLPDAREFNLVLPVIGNHKNEVYAYIKNNKECFGRATVNGLPVSNNFYYLHQLQNLYFVLTGEELTVKI